MAGAHRSGSRRELRNHTLVSVFSPPPHTIVAGVGILLSGRYKFTTMPLGVYGEGGSNVAGQDCLAVRSHCWSADCLLGTGGGWLPSRSLAAGAVGANRNGCPTVDCAAVNGSATAAAVDKWLCSGQCRCVCNSAACRSRGRREGHYNVMYRILSVDSNCCMLGTGQRSVEAPCLWDVVADPGERHNLAADARLAVVVASMRAQLVALNASVVPPYSPVRVAGVSTPALAAMKCRAFRSRGTEPWPWFGPWVG